MTPPAAAMMMICTNSPSGSVYFSGLFRQYEYLFRFWLLSGICT